LAVPSDDRRGDPVHPVVLPQFGVEQIGAAGAQRRVRERGEPGRVALPVDEHGLAVARRQGDGERNVQPQQHRREKREVRDLKPSAHGQPPPMIGSGLRSA
jgi:hypothetical protein